MGRSSELLFRMAAMKPNINQVERSSSSDVVSPDDAILIRRVVSGDPQAFGEIYQRHLDAIYRYIFFRTDDSQDAEDLTEEVFLSAWEALPKYRDFGFPFRAWLYRIAHNAVVDYHRRKKLLVIEPIIDQDFPDGSSGLLHDVINLEQARNIAAAITLLPEDHQQVIILRFIEGLSYSEVAQIIKKSEGACRMIQHRALKNLAQLLSKG